jgi:hypothetical protein
VSYDLFRVEINGKITENNNGLAATPISISYSVTNGKTWQDLTSVNANSDGTFSVVWKPSVTGNYIIKATWVLDNSVNSTVNLALLPVIDATSKSIFSVTSNSIISDLAFNSTSNLLSFTVSGVTGTSGYTDLNVAKSLIKDITGVRVYIDGIQLQPSTTETTESWLIHFTYQHSVHEVILQLNNSVIVSTFESQFVVYVIIAVVIAVVLISTMLVLRKKVKV